jgi:hypothetical protein
LRRGLGHLEKEIIEQSVASEAAAEHGVKADPVASRPTCLDQEDDGDRGRELFVTLNDGKCIIERSGNCGTKTVVS